MKECKNYIIATIESWNIEEANKLIKENNNLKIEFLSVKLKNNCVIANVKVIAKEQN